MATRSIKPRQALIVRTLNDPELERFREPVESMLTQANGKARGVIRTHAEVIALTVRAEEDLENRGVPRGKRHSTTLIYTPAFAPPAEIVRVLYPTPSTTLTFFRNTTSWLLMAAQATKVWPDAKETFRLRIGVDATMAIIDKALAGITVYEYSIDVVRDLVFNAREHWYVLVHVITKNKAQLYLVINADIRIVNNNVHITGPDAAGSFALYAKDRELLEAAMVTCRIAYRDVRFGEIKWNGE